MINRKEIKKASRRNLRRNYWACVAACFLLLIFGADYANSNNFLGEKSDFDTMTGHQQTREMLYDIKGSKLGAPIIDSVANNFENNTLKTATKGVMASIANGISEASHTLSFVAAGIEKVVNHSEFWHYIIAILGMLASLAYYMFLQVQMKVGERRFFLENRLYPETRASRIFFIVLTPRNILNVAWIMFLRALFLLLWMFTIVGGVMKFYEYRAIAYILAENPSISRKDCFALSKEMTRGHKMEIFRFDLSFLFWMILGFFTLGLVNIFYINPYYRGAQAEFHVKLREMAIDSNVTHAYLLNDTALYEHTANPELEKDEYPLVYLHKTHKSRFQLSVPWDRKYSIVHIGLIFFAFAMIGYCWEVVYHLVLDGILVNRGSLWGPWIPIYGVGGALVVVLLKPLGKKPPLMAACTFVACGIIEYFTSWAFETFKHIKYWDYSHYLFNLNGRVCLEGLIMFTVLASLGLYVIAPRFDELFKKWPSSVKVPLLCVLTAAFLGDITYTHFHPHTGKGISHASVETFTRRLS